MVPSEIYICHTSTVLESHVLFSWAEELLPLKALYCYFKLWKTSALQLVFLTKRTWRKLMLHLSLGFCSVFWKNVYVDPGITTVFQDCNLLSYSRSCLLTSLQINPANFLRSNYGCPWGHVLSVSYWGCEGMSNMAFRFISRNRSVSLCHLFC